MDIKNFTITKRDGSKDQFSLDKIMNAIIKAFSSVDQPLDLGSVSKVFSHLDIHDRDWQQNELHLDIHLQVSRNKGFSNLYHFQHLYSA